MKRHYFISDDLDDLEHVEEELERNGFVTPQIHVLSKDDAGVAHHEHLHEVEAVMRTDVVRLMKRGALIGVIAAPIILLIAYYSELPAKYTWAPFVCLAIVLLGFCTWEGGFIGIQMPHNQFKKFEDILADGKHIFFVDVDVEQKAKLDRVIAGHPRLEYAGEAKAAAGWFVRAHQKFRNVLRDIGAFNAH
jgi:hypothetical protein